MISKIIQQRYKSCCYNIFIRVVYAFYLMPKVHEIWKIGREMPVIVFSISIGVIVTAWDIVLVTVIIRTKVEVFHILE